eukprot:scaffold57505_cov51-Prasinocladus_malaysianus.AAC.1
MAWISLGPIQKNAAFDLSSAAQVTLSRSQDAEQGGLPRPRRAHYCKQLACIGSARDIGEDAPLAAGLISLL